MNLSLSERWKDMKACYSSCPIPPSPLKSTLRIDAPHNRCSGHYHYHHHCRLHRKGDKTLSSCVHSPIPPSPSHSSLFHLRVLTPVIVSMHLYFNFCSLRFTCSFWKEAVMVVRGMLDISSVVHGLSCVFHSCMSVFAKFELGDWLSCMSCVGLHILEAAAPSP